MSLIGFAIKLLDNIGFRAIKTLGVRVTAIMWLRSFVNIQKILRKRNLIALDKAMSSVGRLQIAHHLGKFTVDAGTIDRMVKEDSFAFGAIRELYVRDCYFRYHVFNPGDISVVVDLGANRGFFSTMCSAFAQRIIAVEPQQEYRGAFEYNMQLNNFSNYTLVNAFIAQNSDSETRHLSFRDLMSRTGIKNVDFLKMDIEGAEFGVFDELPWNAIHCLTLEVHREAGDPQELVNILTHHAFSVITTDSTFRITNDPKQIDYIYARRI